MTYVLTLQILFEKENCIIIYYHIIIFLWIGVLVYFKLNGTCKNVRESLIAWYIYCICENA